MHEPEEGTAASAVDPIQGSGMEQTQLPLLSTEDGEVAAPSRRAYFMEDEEAGEDPALQERSSLAKQLAPVTLTSQEAAVKIQGLFRQRAAQKAAKTKAMAKYHQVFDPQLQGYRIINRRTGSWHEAKPLFFEELTVTPIAMRGIIKLQANARRKLNRKVEIGRKQECFSKHYDPSTAMAFYMDRRTGLTSWTKPSGMGRDDVEYTNDDLVLLQKDYEIKKLRSALEAKDKEVQSILKKRIEEVEIMARRVKVERARLEGADKRTPDMDLWTVEEVMAWFIEEGMPDYDQAILKNRIDGYLLLHLDQSDWDDLGIHNRVHQKRLNFLLEPYKQRWELRKIEKSSSSIAGALSNVVSLSEIMSRHENEYADDAEVESKDDTSAGNSSQKKPSSGSEKTEATEKQVSQPQPQERLPQTQEELDQIRQDNANVNVETLYHGGQNDDVQRFKTKRPDRSCVQRTLSKGSEVYPQVGDVLQVHYSCYLADGNKLVESSRSNRSRPFEFAIGLGQVVKAWDRCLLRVTLGSRVKLTVKPAYAYGNAGMAPLIPPDASLVFDIEIIKFRQRPKWDKAPIQRPGLSEKPYFLDQSRESQYEAYIRGLKGAMKDLENIVKKAGHKETRVMTTLTS